MKEPRRLRESGSPRARALIQAGKREAPGRQTEKVVLAGLGLSGAIGAAPGTASLKSEIVRSPFAKSVASLKQIALSKVGVGVLTAAMAGSAGYVTGRHDERATERGMASESEPPLVASHRAPAPPATSAPSVSSAEPSAERSNASTESRLGVGDSRTRAASALSAPIPPPRPAEEARAPTETVALVPRAPKSETVATAPSASPTVDAGPASTQGATLPVSESPRSSIPDSLS